MISFDIIIYHQYQFQDIKKNKFLCNDPSLFDSLDVRLVPQKKTCPVRNFQVPAPSCWQGIRQCCSGQDQNMGVSGRDYPNRFIFGDGLVWLYLFQV